MPDILRKSGEVSITDPKDSWELVLQAGRTYRYEARNTGTHGRYSFVVKSEVTEYGEDPDKETWIRRVKVAVGPGQTKRGTFTAARSIYGLSSPDRLIERQIRTVSFNRVSVRWIVTAYKAKYGIRIYE